MRVEAISAVVVPGALMEDAAILLHACRKKSITLCSHDLPHWLIIGVDAPFSHQPVANRRLPGCWNSPAVLRGHLAPHGKGPLRISEEPRRSALRENVVHLD